MQFSPLEYHLRLWAFPVSIGVLQFRPADTVLPLLLGIVMVIFIYFFRKNRLLAARQDKAIFQDMIATDYWAAWLGAGFYTVFTATMFFTDERLHWSIHILRIGVILFLIWSIVASFKKYNGKVKGIWTPIFGKR